MYFESVREFEKTDFLTRRTYALNSYSQLKRPAVIKNKVLTEKRNDDIL